MLYSHEAPSNCYESCVHVNLSTSLHLKIKKQKTSSLEMYNVYIYAWSVLYWAGIYILTVCMI